MWTCTSTRDMQGTPDATHTRIQIPFSGQGDQGGCRLFLSETCATMGGEPSSDTAPGCGHTLPLEVSSLAVAAYAGSALFIAYRARCCRVSARRSWPLRQYLIHSMLLASTCRLLLLIVLGLMVPFRLCDRIPRTCHAAAVLLPGLAFAGACSSSMLTLLFVAELRLSYLACAPEARDVTVRKLRRVTVAATCIGCGAVVLIRIVRWPPMHGTCGFGSRLPPLGQAVHAVVTGGLFLAVVVFIMQPPFFVTSLIRLARTQRGSAAMAQVLIRWLLVLISLLTASAGRFVFDMLTAFNVPWAVDLLRWNLPEGVLYFFVSGTGPELLIALALSSAVHTTAFSKNGAVPWACHVPLDEVAFGEELGAGSFATVFAGSWGSRRVALKQLRCPRGLGSEERGQLQEAMETEAALLCKEVRPRLEWGGRRGGAAVEVVQKHTRRLEWGEKWDKAAVGVSYKALSCARYTISRLPSLLI